MFPSMFERFRMKGIDGSLEMSWYVHVFSLRKCVQPLYKQGVANAVGRAFARHWSFEVKYELINRTQN